MKTALANIGKKDEAKLAQNLEKAGELGDTDYIMKHVGRFVEILENISNAADSEESQNTSEDGENVTENTELLREQLELIKTACDDYDITAAESAFNAVLGSILKSSTRQFLEEVRDILYADSDFDAVSEKIDEFISQ